MRHESINIVYDSCQAVAEEMASRLGAEAVGIVSLSPRTVENSQSLILGIEFQDANNLTPHWQYGLQALLDSDLRGKAVAVFVATGNPSDHAEAASQFCQTLQQKGAHVVSEVAYVIHSLWDMDHWIGTISPSI